MYLHDYIMHIEIYMYIYIHMSMDKSSRVICFIFVAPLCLIASYCFVAHKFAFVNAVTNFKLPHIYLSLAYVCSL